MLQLISSTSNYHFFTLFVVLLLFLNNHQISANSLTNQYDYGYVSPVYDDFSYEDIDNNRSPMLMSNPNKFYRLDNEEGILQNPWSKLFQRHSNRIHYSPAQTGFALRHGQIEFIPYPAEKRAIAIPIEFQKALFAHGIVGRRR